MTSSKLSKDYDLSKLVNHRWCGDPSQENTTQQIICDIDKTYLETKFETLIGLARTALEDAKNKKTVPGAKELLQNFRWGPKFSPTQNKFPKSLHFVSSSPPQMRQTIEEKILRDALDWTSDTLKDQIYNIRNRRFDLLKQQIAYKTLAILRLVLTYQEPCEWVLIGDNAESDPFIYLGMKLFLESKISISGLRKFLECLSVEDTHIPFILEEAEKYHGGHRVSGILIRKIKPEQKLSPLTDSIFYFENFLQSAIKLLEIGFLEQGSIDDIAHAFHNLYQFSREDIKSCLQKLSPLSISEGVVMDENTILALVEKWILQKS